MLSALIAAIIALFAFLGTLVAPSALLSLQNAQDKVVEVLSEVSKDENSSTNSNGNENDVAGNENGNENGDGQNGNGDSRKPDTTKVAAYNTAAGFVLPTLVPQVAVDKSPVLISCDDPEADCEDTSPGKSREAQDNGGNGGNGSENSSNGNIGLDKADEARSKRP